VNLFKPMATNASVTTEPQLLRELRDGGARFVLRYSGFDQRDNTRSYVFQYLVPGEKSRPIVVSAEIPLLIEHHIRIQDGPALCLHTLTLEMQGFDLSRTGTLRRVLSSQDLLAYLASQASTVVKDKRGKRSEGEAYGPSQ
jgi:hypothetical protein